MEHIAGYTAESVRHGQWNVMPVTFPAAQHCHKLNFEALMTLTLDRVVLHTIMHHSSNSTYTPNFIKIEGTFCGRTDVQTDERTDGHLRPALLGWFGRRVDLKRNEKSLITGQLVRAVSDVSSAREMDSDQLRYSETTLSNRHFQ